MRGYTRVAALILMTGLTSQARPEPAPPPASIDQQRQNSIAEFRSAGIPDPERIRAAAATLFAKPIEQQPEAELQSLARAANAAANHIGLLEKAYDDYRRENFEYRSVIQPALRVRDSYVRLANEFKGIRNRAYYNLGHKAEAKGDRLEALYLYNDAFRLERFACESPTSTPEECLRLAAELAMQRLLNVKNVAPYVRF